MNTPKKKLTIAHSPDSDDAYMMAPLALGWLQSDVDFQNFEFEFVRQDIEKLNGLALEGRYDVTAISFGAYPEIRARYDLLTAGSSIQEGTGPVLVGGMPLGQTCFSGLTVAIPGLRTSAYLALRQWMAAQGITFDIVVMPFDEILPAVEAGNVPAGLLIHESQLMYKAKGLHLLVDLGAWWKTSFDLPLPMGGNAIRKGLDEALRLSFARLMRKSVVMARERHEESVDYAQSFGRGMDREMVSRYVQAWVNEFTEDPTPQGRLAVEKLLGLAPIWIQG